MNMVGGFKPTEKYESQLGSWTSQDIEKIYLHIHIKDFFLGKRFRNHYVHIHMSGEKIETWHLWNH